jgi:HTH-type transcriptional regulator, sugar sensing transcriptional regulator
MENNRNIYIQVKHNFMMDTSILEDIGLTNAEIKVYIALLELGTTTAGPILDKTGLQNSVVHMTLHKLLEKGFATYILKGKTRHYQASDPKNILNFIEQKKKKFETLLPELLIRQKTQEKQEAEIYEGIKGFKNAHYEMIEEAKKGDEYLFFSFSQMESEYTEQALAFFKDFERERKLRGIAIKGICPRELRNKLLDRDMSTMLFVDFPIPTNISICNDKVIFMPWEDKPITILVHSRQLAESFKNFFYSIWNKYKK